MTSSPSKFVLYSLYYYLKQLDKHLKSGILKASISKISFINTLKKNKILNKSERTIYKNLEDLEKESYIIYKNRSLSLTKKGLDLSLKIDKGINNYIKLTSTPIKIQKEFKTVFKN